MTALMPKFSGDPESDLNQIKAYLSCLRLIERMHRLMLDLIKDDFERVGRNDLTSIQALLLYNLGGAEVAAGELRSRGMYQGSNVSYNLKKLISNGYVYQSRSDLDRRSVRVRLSETGQEVHDQISKLFMRHAKDLSQSGVLDNPSLEKVNLQWLRVEQYWIQQIRYIY